VDALVFGLVDLGGGVPRGGAVIHERLHHGLVGRPLDAWSAAVQVARREGEHFGRFAARDVGVSVPLQVAAHVNAEDAALCAVLYVYPRIEPFPVLIESRACRQHSNTSWHSQWRNALQTNPTQPPFSQSGNISFAVQAAQN
jgi:hypothetical protein